jgi:small GTP-binding protein
MALFNYATKEITLKVVYYGTGLCGKTTNLQQLHASMSADKKGKLLSLSTDADRTLFFDFMPVTLGKIKDFHIRFQLYTVPGQVRYNATRKLVLKGADAVVFVADSQTAMKEQNVESLNNMKENLTANNINPEEIPVVLQYNKRDLKKIMPVAELDTDLNPKGDSIIEASAYEGWGIDETFQIVTKRLLQFISKKHNIKIAEPEEEKPVKKAEPAVAGQINISVEDKANRMLRELSAIEEAPEPEPLPVDAVEVSVAGDESGAETDWSGLLEEEGAVAAEAEGVSSEWEGGAIEIETEGPAAGTDKLSETSRLEQMLAAEERERGIEPPAEESYNESGIALGGETQIDSGMVSQLAEEVRSLKAQNEEILKSLNALRESLKPLIAMSQQKKPQPK